MKVKLEIVEIEGKFAARRKKGWWAYEYLSERHTWDNKELVYAYCLYPTQKHAEDIAMQYVKRLIQKRSNLVVKLVKTIEVEI